jgi:hypothetical protein
MRAMSLAVWPSGIVSRFCPLIPRTNTVRIASTESPLWNVYWPALSWRSVRVSRARIENANGLLRRPSPTRSLAISSIDSPGRTNIVRASRVRVKPLGKRTSRATSASTTIPRIHTTWRGWKPGRLTTRPRVRVEPRLQKEQRGALVDPRLVLAAGRAGALPAAALAARAAVAFLAQRLLGERAREALVPQLDRALGARPERIGQRLDGARGLSPLARELERQAEHERRRRRARRRAPPARARDTRARGRDPGLREGSRAAAAAR